MGFLLLLGFLVLISTLSMAGRTADSRDDSGRFDWSEPFTPGRDPTLGLRRG